MAKMKFRDALRHYLFKQDPLAEDCVSIMRAKCREWLGFNCTFVDDDMRVICGLAQRAVLAGLASDFSDSMQRRFTEAAEKHRAEHERALGYPITLVTPA